MLRHSIVSIEHKPPWFSTVIILNIFFLSFFICLWGKHANCWFLNHIQFTHNSILMLDNTLSVCFPPFFSSACVRFTKNSCEELHEREFIYFWSLCLCIFYVCLSLRKSQCLGTSSLPPLQYATIKRNEREILETTFFFSCKTCYTRVITLLSLLTLVWGWNLAVFSSSLKVDKICVMLLLKK